MRHCTLLLVSLFLNSTTFSQKSVKAIFDKHQFACDSGTTQLEMNICNGEKAAFVDSLENRLYQRIIRFLDREINKNAKLIADHRVDSSDRQFAEMERKYYTATKFALVNSQKRWKDSGMQIVNLSGSVVKQVLHVISLSMNYI